MAMASYVSAKPDDSATEKGVSRMCPNPARPLVQPGEVRRLAEQRKLHRRLADGSQQTAFPLLQEDPVGVVGRLTGKCGDRGVGGVDPDGLQPADELGAVEASRSDVRQ